MTMKIKNIALGFTLAMGISSLSYGYSLADSTNVGALDTFVASTTQASLGNSNPETEKSWVESILGYSVLYEDKTENAAFNISQESISVVAIELQTTPSHFVVKDSKTFALFSNNHSMDWGVLDLSQYFGMDKLEELQFSHVSEFSDNTLPVPEPGSAALLALGLLGLYITRRKNPCFSAS